MISGSEVMCRKKVDTLWSIYRVFTVMKKNIKNSFLFKTFFSTRDLQLVPET